MKNCLMTLVLLVIAAITFGQNVDKLYTDDMSYDEKIAAGKAYIDETFPDCDFDYFAPNCIYNKKFSSEDERQTMKKDWFEKFRYEYELCEYYNSKKANSQMQENDMQLREKEQIEKEKQHRNK